MHFSPSRGAAQSARPLFGLFLMWKLRGPGCAAKA